MTWTAESDPLEIVKDLLKDNWTSIQEAPLPQFLVQNAAEDPIATVDLRDGDYVIIFMPRGQEIRTRGNITYLDHIFPIQLILGTMISRQRLRDMAKMIETIVWVNKHNVTSWQFLKMTNYQEISNRDLNIWRADIHLELYNQAISAYTFS